MNTAEKIYHQVKQLPEPLAQEVLAFVDNLKIQHLPENPLQPTSLLAVLATLEDIDESFPDVDEGLLPLDDIKL